MRAAGIDDYNDFALAEAAVAAARAIAGRWGWSRPTA
jgi:hypothetical protein